LVLGLGGGEGMEANKNNSGFALYKQIKPRKLSDDIFEQVKSLIFKGELKPGEKLPPERELAQYFDVGRSSLREALIQLSAVGLIEARKTDGYFVRSIAEDMIGPLKAFIEDELRNLLDFMEVRKILDIWCAGEAINKGTEEDFRQIREAVELGQDAGFHIAIAKASHNIILYHLVAHMHKLLSSISFIKKRRQNIAERTSRQHRKILDAIIEKDRETAENAIREHIDAFIEDVKSGLTVK
jgi:GntR family transcriptional regulator, transcriptional repressor for pyruvate dehydrogenase complex